MDISVVKEYTWIFGVGMVIAFVDAFGIGANDVANSFATSVSSNSLTMAQACIIACFTEFGGAVLLGANTAETIKGGILAVDNFVDNPPLLMLAMMCAFGGSASWVIIATKYGWPVSSTHSIVGAILGTGIAAFGGGSITWGWDGVAQIIASWFISPVAAGVVSAFLYLITKYAILRRDESFKWAIRLIPVYFFFTAVIEAFYLIYKGAPGTDSKNMSIGVIIGISIGVGAFCALFCYFFFCPWAVRVIKGREALRWYHIFVIPFLSRRPTVDELDVEHNSATRTSTDAEGNIINSETGEKIIKGEETENAEVLTQTEEKTNLAGKFANIKNKVAFYAMRGLREDVRNLENVKLKDMHASAEVYESDTEYLFSFLQVVTACMASFAHGSNDVSNAVGPISSIFEVWNSGVVDVTGTVPIPVWILVYGGVGIDIGLVTMGYRIMRAMGNNITFFTPSRGFCAELATALTVLTCSKIGLPVSTTHCITGASAAIGLCNKGGIKTVNWKMLGWCFSSWIITLPCAGTMAGVLYAICANSPSPL